MKKLSKSIIWIVLIAALTALSGFKLANSTQSTTEKRKEAIELVKVVYDKRVGVDYFEAGDGKTNVKERIEVYVYTKNGKTNKVLDTFSVDLISNKVYLKNKQTGKFEFYADVKFKHEIDKYLTIIMSSPMESSNSADYIKAHKKEYNAIVALGQEALYYLRSIWDNGDHGLRGVLALSLCKTIGGDINFVTSSSPNSKYTIETFGVYLGSMNGAAGIRLTDNSSKKAIWEMTPGYFTTEFKWSNDSRFVSVFYVARIYGDSVIFDTNTKKTIYLPDIQEIRKHTKLILTENGDRADPYYTVTKWISNTKVKVSFEWTGQNDILFSGEYDFDVVKKGMSNLKIKKSVHG